MAITEATPMTGAIFGETFLAFWAAAGSHDGYDYPYDGIYCQVSPDNPGEGLPVLVTALEGDRVCAIDENIRGEIELSFWEDSGVLATYHSLDTALSWELEPS
jgi:hypothetical protein